MPHVASLQCVRAQTAGALCCVSCKRYSPATEPRTCKSVNPYLTFYYCRYTQLKTLVKTSWRPCVAGSIHASADADASGSAARKTLHRVNDSVKWVVTLTAAFILLRYGNVSVNWCLDGSVIAALSCKVLKKLINKQRPAYARKTDPGMPSSHATSLAYMATCLTFIFSKPLEILCTFSLSVFLVSLRVILGYHSVAQVCAGAALGTTMAVAWHQLGHMYVFHLIATSQSGETILMAITWIVSFLFLVRVIAKPAIASIATTRPDTKDEY